MTYEVKTASSVDDDLFEIAYFIARDNPVKAFSFTEELETFFKSQLKEFPLTGQKLEGVDIWKLSHRGYTAFYKVLKDEKIVHILHIISLGKPIEERGIEF